VLDRFLWSILVLFCIGVGWWIAVSKNPLEPGNQYHPYNKSTYRFDLVDPLMAPVEIRDVVCQGFEILYETQKHAPKFAGNRLTCNNCHFNAGNTLGGANNGISLMGVTLRYPKSLPNKKEYTLPERINDCFKKSMSGKPLPIDDPMMKAIIAYLQWISHEVPPQSKTPWLGLKPLRSLHQPNPENGAQVYSTHCALCHGQDGQGQPRELHLSYPPLWGEHSFNAAAGMNRLPILSSFVYYNMPYEQASLTVEESLDVAAFIIAQPR
jgi:thiosulfate dehydrogenase